MQESQTIFDRQLKKNFVYNTVYQVVTFLSPILISPYLSRVLGPNGIGQFNYTYTVAAYFAMVCLLGIATYGNRECAVCRHDKKELSKTFWSIYSVQILASLIATIAFCIYFTFFAKEYRTLFAIQFVLLLATVLDISWFFQGLELFQKIVVRNVIVRTCIITSVFLFVKTEEDVWKYCLCTVGANFLANFSIWLQMFSYVEKVKITDLDIEKHILPILYLFIPVLGVNIYTSVDKVMLESMIGVESVGFYANAEGLCKFPYGIVTSLTTVILPRISHLSATQRIEKENVTYRKAFEKTVQVTMAIAFPICMGIAAIIPEMVPWYYTTSFMPCIRLIQLLSVLILLTAWTNAIQSHYIVPLNMDHVLTRSSIIALFLNIGANYILILKYGVYGAAYGTILTEIVVLLYKTWSVWPYIDCWSVVRTMVPFGSASIVMYFVVRSIGCVLVEPVVKTTVLQIMGGMLCYGVLMAAYLGITRFGDMTALVRKLVERKNGKTIN